MDNLTASYRIVYFQPNPEDGDRVSVGLLFSDARDIEVLYDPSFPKLKCLAPHVDPELVKIHLDSLDARLHERGVDFERQLAEMAPHFITSGYRKVAWPLTDRLRVQLMRRFLSKEGYVSDTEVAERAEKVDPVQVHLRELLGDVRPRVEEWRENAKSEWVIGQRVPRIKPVALALRKRNQQVVIIDGVDLTAVTSPKAITRIGKVAYTFFQYGRVETRRVKRVGVVVNGAHNPTAQYRDTHDFAMQEFTQEADLAIDTASPEGLEQLRREFISE
jgi:hypothetical protein